MIVHRTEDEALDLLRRQLGAIERAPAMSPDVSMAVRMRDTGGR